MKINGFTGVSLINYKDKICSVVYTSPCNLKCPFCHNPALIAESPFILNEQEILDDIGRRRNFIDGVTITGGEPTLQRGLEEFFIKIKDMGLKTKLDTNGYRPDVLKYFLEKSLIDHVSMDIKSSPEKYSEACGINVNFNMISESIGLVMTMAPDYDFRTTVVPGIIERSDLADIGRMIEGARLHILQQFSNDNAFDKKYMEIQPYPDETIYDFASVMRKYVKEVRVSNTLTLV